MPINDFQKLVFSHFKGIRRWQIPPQDFDETMVFELALKTIDNPITKHLEFFFGRGEDSLYVLSERNKLEFDPLARDDFVLYEAGLAKKSINAYKRLHRDSLRLIKIEQERHSSGA